MGKPQVSGKKHLGAEKRDNKLNPQMASRPEWKPRPHQRKASALATVPTVFRKDWDNPEFRVNVPLFESVSLGM